MIDSVVLKIRNFVLFEPDEHFKRVKKQELKGKYGVFGRHMARYTGYPQKEKKQGRYFP
jgi:hypothetical protein